jgi:hypothetical protein
LYFESGGEGEQGGVVHWSGEELNGGTESSTDVFAREGDGGEAGEASGSGVAEDGFSGVGVVLANAELADGEGWGDEKVEGSEEG